MSTRPPVFFFAFANDRDEYLPTINRERKNIYRSLRKHKDAGRIRVEVSTSTTVEDIFETINHYKQQIAIFHYGGHAGGTMLQLEESSGENREVGSGGLAQLLGLCKELQLVFLNGCATKGQVALLLKEGVKAVIATSVPVNDTMATEFAEQFYNSLAGHTPLQRSFKFAKAFVEAKYQEQPSIDLYRGFAKLEETKADQGVPWGLYVKDETVLHWSIPETASSPPQPTFRSYGGQPIPQHLTALPFRSEVFLGREEDMEAVRSRLFDENNMLLLVNGRGGVGKTTLAAHYYHRYQDDYQHLAWVLSERSITNALLSLARPLGVSFDARMPNEERLPILLTEMARLAKPCLLVIDNANEVADLEANYLALRRCPNFHLLCTTRITEFEQAERYAIEGLPRDEALALFKRFYPLHRESENELFYALHQAVWGNTLVIELLAKNLAQFNNRLKTRYALPDLLHDLGKEGLLGLKGKKISAHYQAGELELRKETPEAIIGAMYDLGELSEEERRVLSLFAVLPAENIAFDVLDDLLGGEEKLDEYLLSLAQKGWLENIETDFKASPVVQEITRRKNETLRENCQSLIDGLIRKLDYEGAIGHFVNATYEEAALLALYGESVAAAFAKADNDLAILCERIGNFHQTTGNLIQALGYFEQYHELRRELYEAYPQNVSFKNGLAISYEKLGSTQSALGNLEAASGYYEQYTVKIRQKSSPNPIPRMSALKTYWRSPTLS
jgi:GTPase SAR1 family protein